MPARAVRQPESPEQAVREANQRFYQAFANLDLGQMSDVWLHDDSVECVHPGWDLLLGWDEVRESWARIFSNTRRIKIEIRSVWVRVEGDVAWVACTEQITSSFENSFDQALLQATNIFVRRDASADAPREPPEDAPDSVPPRPAREWRLVAHHASPLVAVPTTPLQ